MSSKRLHYKSFAYGKVFVEVIKDKRRRSILRTRNSQCETIVHDYSLVISSRGLYIYIYVGVLYCKYYSFRAQNLGYCAQ